MCSNFLKKTLARRQSIILVHLIISSGSSLIYNTSARHKLHECITSDTNATQVTQIQHKQHECNTRATRVLHKRHECNTRTLILTTTRIKTYFHSPTFTIWQVKDYKERNNFILRTTFWKCLVPMPKCVWKVHHKNWTF